MRRTEQAIELLHVGRDGRRAAGVEGIAGALEFELVHRFKDGIEILVLDAIRNREEYQQGEEERSD